MIKFFKILFAERDKDLALITKNFLVSKGFSTVTCFDGEDAMQHYWKERFDLIIIDVNIPTITAWDIINEIRRRNLDIPIVCLGINTNLHEKLKVLDAGADDFLLRPLCMEELGKRIEIILSRKKTNEKKAHLYTFGCYTLDTLHHLVICDDNVKHLTPKELDLLFILIQYKNRVVERSFALKHIWRRENYFNARNMDVYVGRLRQILCYDPTVYVENVHGIGYKLVVP